MFNSEQFRQHVIVPALSIIQQYSKDAEELLIFTCGAESNGGTFLKQVGGPACEVFQMEPATHQDIWVNYISARAELTYPLGSVLGINRIPMPEKMIHDLIYASIMARIHYLRVPEKLPSKDDVDGLWAYYKKYYNTTAGKATKAASIKKYEAFSQR